jgi:drug/metabolite transporter (DMT)-like permease
MSPIITLLVLAAAVMHASWNALIKAGSDKVVMQCLVMFFAGVPCIPFLLFVPLPAPASWPFLALSLAVHGVYYATLINAYRFGALSQVYPIARGAAPLMIALGAWAFAGEAMSALEWAGVIVASVGIMSLAAPGKLPREEELKAIGFALATSITIALYSLADGIGVRRAGESMSYILWLLSIDAFPVMVVGLWLRRGRVVESFRPHLKWAAVGGLLSALGYGIVIWAMGKAPLAQVSALRESSVILAAIIGTALLGESFGRRRILAAVLVAAGNGLLHIAG